MPDSTGSSRSAVFWLMAALLVAVVVLTFQIVQTRVTAQHNQEIFCIGIMGNDANTAASDDRVRELCAEVGVS